VPDALAHMHKKGFRHCNLKSNNVVSTGKEYFLHFGKACPITSPSAKKYQKNYPHIALEVLCGSLYSKHSDVYSWGNVLKKKWKRKKTFEFFQTLPKNAK